MKMLSSTYGNYYSVVNTVDHKWMYRIMLKLFFNQDQGYVVYNIAIAIINHQDKVPVCPCSGKGRLVLQSLHLLKLSERETNSDLCRKYSVC